jgi:hypothetical protein
MGVRELRVPLDDLADPETRNRMIELTALGHDFTAYSFGLPKGTARQALLDYGHILSAWEVIAPTTSAPDVLGGIIELKGDTRVFFNGFRTDVEAFSSSHGLDVDERGTVEALLALDGARDIINGVVFGIGWQDAPGPAMDAINKSIAGLGVSAAVHVQFAHRKPLGEIETARHDDNRVAEAVLGALAVHIDNGNDVTVYLDNFTGIDRGYYFSSGLVDRLYNPLAGAHIVRHLHAALPVGCQTGETRDLSNGRLIELNNPDGALFLPARDTDTGTLPPGRWIDLISGALVTGQITGPALMLDS